MGRNQQRRYCFIFKVIAQSYNPNLNSKFKIKYYNIFRAFGSTGNDWNLYPRIIRALSSPSNSPHESEESDEDEEVKNGAEASANEGKKRRMPRRNGSSTQETGPTTPKRAKKQNVQ